MAAAPGDGDEGAGAEGELACALYPHGRLPLEDVDDVVLLLVDVLLYLRARLAADEEAGGVGPVVPPGEERPHPHAPQEGVRLLGHLLCALRPVEHSLTHKWDLQAILGQP